eukprot:16437349-Heterocapsa_arctica.AAC.1
MRGKTNTTGAPCRGIPAALTPMAGSSADGRVVYHTTRLGKDNQGDITPEGSSRSRRGRLTSTAQCVR